MSDGGQEIACCADRHGHQERIGIDPQLPGQGRTDGATISTIAALFRGGAGRPGPGRSTQPEPVAGRAADAPTRGAVHTVNDAAEDLLRPPTEPAVDADPDEEDR